MTPDEALKIIERGELLPLWLLTGEERLLRDQVLAAIDELGKGGA